MEMCRACLSTEEGMPPLDEMFINNYNILTNLNITLLDGMPQYTCLACLDIIKYFVEFREKCIKADTTLREIFCSDVKTKNENKKIFESLFAIKPEIKEESYDPILEELDHTFEEYTEDIKEHVISGEEDIKPNKKTRKKKKTIQIDTANLIENLRNGFKTELFCGICPKTFEKVSELNNHLDTHSNDRICDICRQQVNSLSQLLAHRLMHVPIKQSNCHICEKRFRSCLYLEHHYRNMHITDDANALFCKHCPSSYNTPKKLNGHMRQVHSNVRYVCDMCSKDFGSKTNLKSHIKYHSQNKAYVCDLCGFSCKHSGGLKDHKIRRHTLKKVYCKTCKRVFPTQEGHDKHKCVEKVTVCPVCGLQLNGNSRLSKHMLVHNDIPKYECKRCPAKYKSRSSLMAHLDRHDGNRTKQCEYCPAKFYSATVLIKHRRIHTGEKPYVCKVCSKGFTARHNLKVHMKVHGEYLIVKKNSEQEELIKVTK